jgi:hypothetical protein
MLSNIQKCALLLLMVTALCTQPSFANDSLATVSSDEIQYAKSKDIVMRKELLLISTDQITVEYDFFNPTDKDINSDVAFPLPPTQEHSAVWDQDYIARTVVEENPGANHPEQEDAYYSNRSLFSFVEKTPFLNFKRVAIEERPYTYELGFNTRVIAVMPDGKDITSLLKKHDIPLSALLLSGWMEAGWIFNKPELKSKLANLKLLSQDERPLWNTQTIYFWKDKFPAKQVHKVKHTYRPATGQNWAYTRTKTKLKSFEDIEFGIDSRAWADYCVDAEFKKKLSEHFKDSKKDVPEALAVYEVGYILSTGANWNGPIQDFRLEVTQPKDTLVSYCAPGGAKIEKTRDGKYVTQIKDFTPKSELRIIFVAMKPAA